MSSSPRWRAARRSDPVSRETPPWVRVADEIGHPLSSDQVSAFSRFRDWLATEARDAGGIGPHEIDRIDDRHLADSVLYAHFFDNSPTTWCDLGSGVGLPGIPLAIMFPETRCVLVDRSGRRARLLRRVVRILDLDNVEVLHTEATGVVDSFSVVVTRASLPASRLRPVMWGLLDPGGVGVAGGSWVERPTAEGWETMTIISRSLDRTVWFLIMRRQ